MKPLIGITTYGRNKEDEFTLPADYVEAVYRAGATPVLIAPGQLETGHLLARIDGLILSGGGDLDPALYNGGTYAELGALDAERDRTEAALARWVVDAGFPTLAICRGLQMVNVVLGGTLLAPLPDLGPREVFHRLPGQRTVPHEIEVVADSRLAGALGCTSCSVISWHHQAIDRLADGLRVVARAADGVVEAAEMDDHPWLVGIQWHPELSAMNDPVQQRLFSRFVQATIDIGKPSRPLARAPDSAGPTTRSRERRGS
jgi:putative glutamine amidotransferase